MRLLTLRLLVPLLIPMLGLFSIGCKCEYKETKCEDGKLYQCRGALHFLGEQWEMIFDCGELDARCREGKFEAGLPLVGSHLEFPDFFTDPQYGTKANHMCVSRSHECSGVGRLECTADHRAIVNCEAGKDGPRPVILAERPEGFTHCVATEDGAGFTIDDSPCDRGDAYCLDEFTMMYCEHGIWLSKECSQYSTLGCQQVIDTDGNDTDIDLSAVCHDTESCLIPGASRCAPHISDRAYYYCMENYRWFLSVCAEYDSVHQTCHQLNETSIECR